MTDKLKDFFYGLADTILEKRSAGEEMRISFDGEESDFIRFNNAAIRQPGSVEQKYLTIELIREKKHSSAEITLTGEKEIDLPRIDSLLDGLREDIKQLEDDPYLLLPDDPQSSEYSATNHLPSSGHAIEKVLDAAKGMDFVGIFAAGGVFAGYASSLGQKSWFSNNSFHLDFSVYALGDKAIKESYAGFEWNDAFLVSKIKGVRKRLEIIKRTPKVIDPGKYRVFIAPAAMEEIISLLAWNSFGLRSRKKKTSSLIGMIEGESTLSPMVTIKENTAEGLGPSFDDAGFLKPPSVTLINEGRIAEPLVSPRSAVEYNHPTNAAEEYEYPMSIDMSPGTIRALDVMQMLDEGVYIGNLWYLNYSDQKSCRMTGMTRFGTFWVEDGKITAPVSAMRFDESIYRLLGNNLAGLTMERDLLPDPSTYYSRSTRSSLLPGALVSDFTFTL